MNTTVRKLTLSDSLDAQKKIAREVVNGLLDKEIVADRSLSVGKSDMLKAKSRGKRTIEKYGLK